MTAQGIQAFLAPESEPLQAGIAALPHAEGHWVEVLFDRMDQLEFTLSGETGAQGELLQAVGEIGSQLDAVLARLDTPAPALLPPGDAETDPMTDDSDLAAADELLTSALHPIHDGIARLSVLVQGIASRQDEMANALSDRIDQIESRLAQVPEQGSPPDRDSLSDQIAGLESRLDARLLVVLDRPLPRPDFAPVHQSVARLATAIKGYADDQARALTKAADRLDRIETAVSAFAGPRALASLIDALESRMRDRLDRGLNAILAALPAPGTTNLDRERDSMRRATAALEAVTSLASENEATTRLTEMVEGIAARLATPETVPAPAPDLEDLTHRLGGLLDARDALLATRLDDMSRNLAALRAQDQVHRLSANLMTALSAYARSNAAQHAETQALLSSTLPARDMAEPQTVLPSGISDLLAAAGALHAQLADTPDQRSADPAIEGLTRELRITVAETLAEAERRLSLEGRTTG